jgi:2-polyprenyl-3-methyl-5-hydroxy-6-metoxy-1,4-benzoquinol methylase
VNPSTQSFLDRIVGYIHQVADPTLAQRLHSYIAAGDALFRQRAEEFFGRYARFQQTSGSTFEAGIDHFLWLHNSLEELRADFLKTGRYCNSSFEEVNRSHYSDPAIMQRHMHGLVFAQFLWPDQYQRFHFFSSGLPAHKPGVQRYLEIGGGHGLYVSEATRVFETASVEVVDISPTSLELARAIVAQPRVRYHLMNVFDFPDGQYDFITAGELIEHLENPREMLEKMLRMLAPGGHAFLTTPANAPMADHIYLFRNAQEIRDLLQSSGFQIVTEAAHYAVDIKPQLAERMKLPLMYAAFLRKP